MGRVAAIDYGLKRIGVAVTDKERKIAFPVAVVEGGKKAVQNVMKALPLKEVDLILVGLPLMMSGEKAQMALLAEEFAKILHEACGIAVQLWDERLSSKQAERGMKEISLKQKNRSEKVDMIAATLLLQSFLGI